MLSFFSNFLGYFHENRIKTKFVDRFSLKNLSAAIDQCTIKSPNFVYIEKMFKTLQWNHSPAAGGFTWVLNILWRHFYGL